MKTSIFSQLTLVLLSLVYSAAASPGDAEETLTTSAGAISTHSDIIKVAKDADTTTTTSSSTSTGMRIGILVVCAAVGVLVLWGFWVLGKRYLRAKHKQQQQQVPEPYPQYQKYYQQEQEQYPQYQQYHQYQPYYHQQQQYPPPARFKEQGHDGYKWS